MPEFQNDLELVEYMGTDAQKWTEQFLIHTNLANAGPDFQGTVLSWFANAIEQGKDAGLAAAMAEIKSTMRELDIDDTSEMYTIRQAAQFLYSVGHDRGCFHA